MASRINFWRDINTKDGEYKNAVIVSGDKQKKIKSESLNKYKNTRKIPTRKQFGQDVSTIKGFRLDYDSNDETISNISKSQYTKKSKT